MKLNKVNESKLQAFYTLEYSNYSNNWLHHVYYSTRLTCLFLIYLCSGVFPDQVNVHCSLSWWRNVCMNTISNVYILALRPHCSTKSSTSISQLLACVSGLKATPCLFQNFQNALHYLSSQTTLSNLICDNKCTHKETHKPASWSVNYMTALRTSLQLQACRQLTLP